MFYDKEYRMAINEVCRLCLATENLEWIFEETNEKLNMRDVVSITTGIEIHAKDIISQKICTKCYQFSIQIFQFRGRCLKADKYLKDLCMDYVIDKKYYIPNTEVAIKNTVKSEEIPKPKPVLKRPSIHPSIIHLSRAYPHIKLPIMCLSSNITPIVEMEMDQVENHFRRLKLDFKQCVKDALIAAKIFLKRKRPSRAPKALKQNSNVSEDISDTEKDNKCNEEQNTSRTPNKNQMKAKQIKSPIRTNIMKRFAENPTKKKIDKAEVECESGSNTDNSVPNKRKRKPAALEKTLKEGVHDSSKRDVKKESLTHPINNNKRNYEKSNLNRGMTLASPPNSPARKRRKALPIENSDASTTETSCPVNKIVEKKTHVKEKPSKSLPLSNTTDSSKINCGSSDVDKDTNTPINKDGIPVQVENTIEQKTDSELVITDVRSVADQLDENCDSDSLTNIGRSVPLVMCEICNSVQYNMYDLKKHQSKHMRCQFCKIRFRSLGSKNLHLETQCRIKKMMNDLPDVALTRIELDRKIKRKYSSALAGFSSLSPVRTTKKTGTTSVSAKRVLFKDVPSEKSDIREVVSDEISPVRDKQNGDQALVPDVSSNVFKKLNAKPANSKRVSTLLTGLQKESTELNTQTNSYISVMGNEAVLKKLPSLRYFSPIEVKTQPGEFNVYYDYNIRLDTSKKLCLWDDLTPVDIRTIGSQSQVVVKTELVFGESDTE